MVLANLKMLPLVIVVHCYQCRSAASNTEIVFIASLINETSLHNTGLSVV